jgi:3-phenylpropionate/cinnamic acid dioxygenase small subunit
VRIERLKHPRVYSQQIPSFCQHVLQRPEVLRAKEGTSIETKTAFIYVESHAEEQLVLAGTVHHELRTTTAGLKIFRKRIELLNRDSSLPSIQLFL